MPRISRLERLKREAVEVLREMAADPLTPKTARQRAASSIRSYVREQERDNARKQAAAAKRAKDAAPQNWNVLPDNGRSGTSKQAPPRLPVNPDLLPRAGESPAQTRARLEALAD